jgi:hypothetical protein
MKSAIFLFALCALATNVHADTVTHIYECIVNGEHVFSDHACSDNAIERSVTVTSRMDSVRLTARSKPEHNSNRVHTSRRSSDVDERRVRCAKIRKARDTVNDQLRAGFTARQDERLHDRLRKLDGEYFELRCSSVAN